MKRTEKWLIEKALGMSSKTNSKNVIEVHKLTNFPTEAWEVLRDGQRYCKLDPIPLNHPIAQSSLRCVCVSDTHSAISCMKFPIPPGDVLIHAGDFTKFGTAEEVRQFNKFLGSLPHKHKIVIAGNHELCFDPNKERLSFSVSKKDAVADCISLLTNCTYLEDSAVEINGVHIYGSPWQPEYMGWAFNLQRGDSCLEKWNLIPENVDILVTHGPPLGHGDYCKTGVRAGCVELLSTIQSRVKPKYHVFGHIHEDYGLSTDGQTIYINASSCNVRYQPVNPPIIFDFPLPVGVSKS